MTCAFGRSLEVGISDKNYKWLNDGSSNITVIFFSRSNSLRYLLSAHIGPNMGDLVQREHPQN